MLDLKFSPSGAALAVATHKQTVDVYAAAGGRGGTPYERVLRCVGHSAAVQTVDWSADGALLRSADHSYELLVWDAATGKQAAANTRDVAWATHTAVLGFPVMGVWPADSDGTDVNALHVSHAGGHVLTADDFGTVKLFNAPCVVRGRAP